MANNELLEATMQRIEAHPEKHDQSAWFTVNECGTAFCFAGHAAIEAGAKPPTAGQIRDNGGWWINPDDPIEPHVTIDMRPLMEVQNWAAVQLELTPGQRSALFYDAGDAETLRVMVDAIKADPAISNAELELLVEDVLGIKDEDDEEED